MPISRLIVTACLAGAMLASAPALADDGKRPDKVSFYFAAHEDDWQLFMNPSAFQDVMGGAAKTVFVHLTAGDAGLGIGLGGRKHPFYLARENGAEAAIRFMADADAEPGERSAAPMSFNGHEIYRVSYRNTVSYFLRVPDGHWSGDGYYETGFESLRRLSSGENSVLRAVDGSATYHGWERFGCHVESDHGVRTRRRHTRPAQCCGNRYAHQFERPLRSFDDGEGCS